VTAFAIVPAHVINSSISDQAKVLYAVHSLSPDRTLVETSVVMNRLAGTVRKYAAELEQAGFAVKQKDDTLELIYHDTKKPVPSPTQSRTQAPAINLASEIENFDEFVRHFFEIYPPRGGYVRGKKEVIEWLKRNLKADEIPELLEGVKQFRDSKQAKDGFACDPIRFLKRRMWMDFQEKRETPVTNRATL
jgi:hypothetical protein